MLNTLFKKREKVNPWLYIPSMSFTQGMPIMIVTQTITVMFKSLGASNEMIGLTTLYMLPLSFKFLLAPLLDMAMPKRRALLAVQLAMGVCMALMAAMLLVPGHALLLSALMFAVVAIMTGVHDLPIEGIYIVSLDSKQQAFFSGIKTAFLRISYVFVSGALVVVAGVVGDKSGRIELGWVTFYVILTVLFGIGLAWHAVITPYPAGDVPVKSKNFIRDYFEAFVDFIKMPHTALTICYFLFYRAGEGVLVKMLVPFFLDLAQDGGMGFSVSQVGVMYGTMGAVATIIGGLLGGIVISKIGIRRTMVPMALFMSVPNLLYVALARYTPEQTWTLSLPGGNTYDINIWGQVAIVLECLGYGFGSTGFFVYGIYVAAGRKYKMSFIAIAAGIQMIGWMIPGIVSGYLQQMIGYERLFLSSVFIALPGIVIAWMLSRIKHESF